MSSLSCDCVIVGGGVIGLTTAWTLAEQGVSVAVVERSLVGQEASWAGAGMLPPGNLALAKTAESRLRSLSHTLWSDVSASLLEMTGIDNGYRVCGSLFLSATDNTDELGLCAKSWQDERVDFERLSRTEIEHHVRDLHSSFTQGVFLPDYAQVRNPRHLKAVRAACLQRGVVLHEEAGGLQFHCEGDKIRSVSWCDHKITCGQVCVTAGAWSAELMRQFGIRIPVYPVKGQIVQLQSATLPFHCLIEVGRRYLVPRSDGLILAGSTEEDTGFQKNTTSEGVAGLLQFAFGMVPALRDAQLLRTWAGLRPGTPDELPLIGRVPDFQNLFLGAGHFRSGLQMSLGTARLLSDLILDLSPAISLEGLHCERFAERDSVSPALES